MRYLIMLLSIFPLLLKAEFLMPNEAFIPSATLQNDKVVVHIKLGEHIHIYKEKIKLTANKDAKIFIKSLQLPKAKIEDGAKVYDTDITFDALLGKQKGVNAHEQLSVTLEFQGCSSEGLCYQPIKKTYTFNVDTSKIGEKVHSQTQTISLSFQNKSLFVVLATFFGFGLLLAMTPCIFPMIPILSSIIVAQKEGMTAKKGFTLSLVYVLSMAVAYTIAGVLAGLFGQNLQAAMQNPYVVIVFALVFVALAFSMFGFYEIGLPASLQSKISKVSDDASNKGGFVGVAIMGFLSALIVGPCVAPPLAGTLIYIGQTGDALLGGMALFVMSLGMGVPLLLIGLGTGKFMPKPGGWMNSVSKIFGVVMLGIAIWMLEKILPSSVTMLLWAVLFIISSVYLGAFESLGASRGWYAFMKGLGLVLFLYGLVVFTGALSGAKTLLHPLEPFTQSHSAVGAAQTKHLSFQVVKNKADFDAFVRANHGKKILIDFAAQWCTACKEYDENTFSNKDVVESFASYKKVRIDVTDNTQESKALMKRFGVFGPPAVIVLDAKGDVEHTIIGYKPPKEFLQLLGE